MSNFKKIVLGATCTFAMTGTMAQASGALSHLSAVNGDIVVERNGEYLRAVEFSGVNINDRVVAVNGGSAEIVLSAECSMDVLSGMAVTLVEAETCAESFQVTTLEGANFPVELTASSENALPGVVGRQVAGGGAAGGAAGGGGAAGAAGAGAAGAGAAGAGGIAGLGVAGTVAAGVAATAVVAEVTGVIDVVDDEPASP